MSHFTRIDSITRRSPGLLPYDGPWQGTDLRVYAHDWEREPGLLAFAVDGETEEPIAIGLFPLALAMRRHPSHVPETCTRGRTRTMRILRMIHRRRHAEDNPVSWRGRRLATTLSDLRRRRADEKREWDTLCEVTFREALSEARGLLR